MAIQIPCPTCGPRPHMEFAFGGEERPIEAADADEDFARVFLPHNVRGVRRERWFHARGCKTWFVVERDTANDAIG